MSAVTITLEGAKQLLEEQYDVYPGSLAEPLDCVLWGKEFAARLVSFVLVHIADFVKCRRRTCMIVCQNTRRPEMMLQSRNGLRKE
jgi:hypothetical protein